MAFYGLAGQIEQQHTSAQLTADQRAEMRDAFDLFDADKDSKITSGELGAMMRKLGQNPDAAELRAIMRACDAKGKGYIDFEDFCTTLVKFSPRDLSEQVKDAFEMIDNDGSGAISSEEIKKILQSIGDQATEAEIEEIIREIDLDGDGEIDYQEFVKIFATGH